MSVIGPRPQLVRDMVFMTPEQRMRHTAKPGLSGLAQVNGRNAISWEDKITIILCDIKFKVIHILKVFCEFLYTPDSKTFQIVDNSHKYLKSRLLFSGIHDCYPPSK